MLISRASFAKQLDITKAAVTNNVKKGRIILDENDLVNTDDPINQSFAERIRQRKVSGIDKDRTGRPKGSKNGNTVKKQEEFAKNLVLPPIDLSSAIEYPDSIEDLLRRRGWESLAPNLKILEAWEKTKIENAKKKGELIDRKLVQKFVSKLYAIDTNEFLTSSGKIANLVAGICDVNDDGKIVELKNEIETELYKTLAHIKRVMDDFLQQLDETN